MLRKTYAPYVIALVLLVCVFAFSPNFLAFQSGGKTPFAGDFLQEWIGAYVVWNNGADRLYDEPFVKQIQHDPELLGFEWRESSYFSMVYPPFYYIVLSPLSLLPYHVAAWLFTVLMVVCLFASGTLMLRALPNVNPHRFAWLFVATIWFVPLLRSLTTGQKGTACLLILTGTFYLLKQKRPVWAGVVFGLMAFKPQLALVIGLAMLVKGQFRFAASAVATASFFVGICFAAGTDVCVNYYQFCAGVGEYLHTSGYDLYKSHCLYGFLAMLSGGQATMLVKISTFISVILVFGMLLTILRGKLDTTSKCFNIQFSAMVICTLLLSPHLFTYDLTMLLLPMFLLGHAAQSKVVSRESETALIGLTVAMYFVAGFSHAVAAIGGLQLTTVLMLAMLWILVRNMNAHGDPDTVRIHETHLATGA